MSKDNLLSLKDDMVAFIEGHGLRRLPGYVTEDIPSILWEDHGNPDAWKDFVEMAKHVGAPFITFSEMTLEREELDGAKLEPGEVAELTRERERLVHAQSLQEFAAGGVGLLYDEEGSVVEQLGKLGREAQSWASLDPTLEEVVRRLEGLTSEVQDVAAARSSCALTDGELEGSVRAPLERDPSRRRTVALCAQAQCATDS